MKRRTSTKKRGGAQAAVVIPNDPSLQQHAAAIRELSRQTVKNLIEIGNRLIQCRQILKDQRAWMRWLKTELAWSRRQANRLIDLAAAVESEKLGDVAHFDLSLSALFLLAAAPPKTIELVSQRLEAGERPTVRDITQLTRQQSRPATIASDQPGPRAYYYPPAPPALPKLTSADFQKIRARAVVEQIELFRRRLDGPPGAILSELQPEERRSLIEDAEAIVDFLTAIMESVRPKLVDHDDGGGNTKH